MLDLMHEGLIIIPETCQHEPLIINKQAISILKQHPQRTLNLNNLAEDDIEGQLDPSEE